MGTLYKLQQSAIFRRQTFAILSRQQWIIFFFQYSRQQISYQLYEDLIAYFLVLTHTIYSKLVLTGIVLQIAMVYALLRCKESPDFVFKWFTEIEW